MNRVISRFLSAVLAALALMVSPASALAAKEQRTEHYVYGKLNTPTPGPVSGGLLLMGGGDRNVDAMKWFFAKAGNGHIVVLSASYGKEIGEEFFNDIGGIKSVEIFVMHADPNRRTAKFWNACAKPTASSSLAGTSRATFDFGEGPKLLQYWTPMSLRANRSPEPAQAWRCSAKNYMARWTMAASNRPRRWPIRWGLPTPSKASSLFCEYRVAQRDGDRHPFQGTQPAWASAGLCRQSTGTQRSADQPMMIGLGIDESAALALAVEPDGTGKIYATEKDAWLWLGSRWRGLTRVVWSREGRSNAPRVKVTGIGPGSVVHLPSGRVCVIAGVQPQLCGARGRTGGGSALVARHPWRCGGHRTRRPDRRKGKAAYRGDTRRSFAQWPAVLDKGGTALDAVSATVRILEDNPLFNAGRGAVFTAEGRNELDAAIMDGKTQMAGAVAGITRTRHPIDLARAVMEKTRHVAERSRRGSFLVEQGLEQVENLDLLVATEDRWQSLVAGAKNRQRHLIDP